MTNASKGTSNLKNESGLGNPLPMFRFTIRDVLWLTVVVAGEDWPR
jgi:hypothetical protein